MNKYLAIYEPHATVEATGNDLNDIYNQLLSHFSNEEILENILIVEVSNQFRVKVQIELASTK